MSKYNLTDLYEGMSNQEYADAKEKERLEKHPERDKIKAIQQMMAKEKSMKENYQMDGEVYDRIDGLISQPLLESFLDVFKKIIDDFIESGDEFDADDIVDYLTIQLDKEGQKSDIGKIGEDENISEGDPIVDETEFNFFKTFFGIGSEDVMSNTNATDEEIEAYLKSDDYQEELQHSELDEKDIANWVNSFLEWRDKNNLKEYFDRFK